MKALTKKFGEITILSTENKNSIKVSVNGEVKFLMPAFVEMTNLDGSKIDFATLEIKEEITIGIYQLTDAEKAMPSTRKPSTKKMKLADIMAMGAEIHEDKGEFWNPMLKKYVKK